MANRPSDTNPRTHSAAVLQIAEQLRAEGRELMADTLGQYVALVDEYVGKRAEQLRYDKAPNMPMYVDSGVWDRAVARAAAEGKSIAAVIDDGYTELLAGRWTPLKPERAAPGTAGAKATKNTRVAVDRAKKVTAYVAANAERIDWKPSPAQVAVAWLGVYAPPEGNATA
ncbi:hypothetical protein KCMC57_64370 (plasmid) [Kitasatospora sp. CMC57]|uniref:Uncharacterized protein n=1 Tax=Kitasatospora sp. CMC57 TaxID=3231513 RepID=A0AB33K8S1_9ACTN